MEELKKMLSELSKEMDNLRERGASKADMQKWQDAIDTLDKSSKSEIAKLTSLLQIQDKALSDFMEANGSGKAKFISEQSQINNFIKENIDEIKQLKKTGQGFIEFEVKAVGDISTASGAVIDAHDALGALTNANLRDSSLVQYASVGETSQSRYTYTDVIPKDGKALAVAEGTAKPEIDFKWEERTVAPTKVAAWEKITEEASQDVIGLMSVARDFLRKKHDIAVEHDVYFGDGSSPNSEGATVIARTFVAGGMALKVVKPNMMDVVNAAVTDIATTHNYTDEGVYMANVAMINPVDFYLEFVAAKDERGLPLYPQASLFNVVKIGGLTIVPTERIPSGKIFVADMKRYNIKKYKSYTLRIGQINDDFIKNMFVLLGESRYFAYSKHLDKAAFVYDSIATIKTAITKAP